MILVPTYNEVSNVELFYEAVREVCDFDLMFIDDASPDGTGDKVKEIARKDRGVRLLERSAKEGLGRAYRHAFSVLLESGGWDRVFMMDADLSHRPIHLDAMDEALDEYSMVLGSRYVQGVSVLNWSIIRLNLSYFANVYIRVVTGMPFTDCTSGFRAFRGDLLPLLVSGGIRASGYAFLVETLHTVWKSGVAVGEVPIVFVERRSGTSKVSARVFAESLLTPPRLKLTGIFRNGNKIQ